MNCGEEIKTVLLGGLEAVTVSLVQLFFDVISLEILDPINGNVTVGIQALGKLLA